MAPIPPGFHIQRLSPFNALVGPLYERRDGETVSIGLALEQKHTNSRGICHGGVLATLADLALGYAMLAKSGDKGSFVTAHLAVDYAGAARAGDWIESQGRDPARRRAARLRQLLPGGRWKTHRAGERHLCARRQALNDAPGGPRARAVDAGRRHGAACRAPRASRLQSTDLRLPGRSSYEANMDALARFARDKTLFVGHSLGGVLVLDMLNRHPEIRADAVVLLGAPVRGCLAGRRFGAAGIGRWMMGACRQLWDERAARWTRAVPLGVVAGTLPLGLAAPSAAACRGRTTAWSASRRPRSRAWRTARWCAWATACSSSRDRSAAWSSAFCAAGRFA